MKHLLTLITFLIASVCIQAQTTCAWNPDYNGDSNVGVTDLLALLGVFSEFDEDNPKLSFTSY